MPIIAVPCLSICISMVSVCHSQIAHQSSILLLMLAISSIAIFVLFHMSVHFSTSVSPWLTHVFLKLLGCSSFAVVLIYGHVCLCSFETALFKLEILDHKARERAGIITPTLGSPVPVLLQFDAAAEVEAYSFS